MIGHERILAMDEGGNDEEPFDLFRISIEWPGTVVASDERLFCFFVREQHKMQ